MYENLDEIDQKFDVVTLFHVLEHIPNQIETLKNIKKVIHKKGKLFIEIPHANDLLLNLKVFRNFTLWSEHLVLHTKFSIIKYLKISGFKIDKVVFIQRYNFLNHLRWFLEGKPDGHSINQKIYDKDIIRSYEKFLVKNQLTDTIFVEASLD
jgi:SAM-dependent methyltransferase